MALGPPPSHPCPGSRCSPLKPSSRGSCLSQAPADLASCRAHMGLCYSLRPLLFGDPEDAARATSEPAAEPTRQSPAPVPVARGDVALTRLPPGAGGSPACARPKANPKKEWRRRPDQQSTEEREAEREARKVSRNIDRMLREQKRDLQQTHRLLLLGRCGARGDPPERANSGPGGGELPSP